MFMKFGESRSVYMIIKLVGVVVAYAIVETNIQQPNVTNFKEKGLHTAS